MLQEFTRALKMLEAEPHRQLELCRWVTTRGLLGVAKVGGFESAASLAYRCADTLAGAVR